MKQENKGITLIALVITIIVLLILAGVSIATLTGENGILTKAQNAKVENTKSQAEEEVKLAVGTLQIEESTKEMTQEEKRKLLEDELKEQETESTVAINGKVFLVSHRGHEFEIDSKYKVKEAFNAEEWDKTASPDELFEWDETGTIIVGYKDTLAGHEKIRISSKCTAIIPNYAWQNNLSTRSIISGGVKKIELPDTIKEIGKYAFGDFKDLESINIPDNITSIGEGAFSSCASLTNITIPESVTSIGKNAFYFCTSLTNITIPNSVISIGNSAFSECWNLTNITISENVTNIGDWTFCDTSLTSITIPNSVINMGAYVFAKWEANQTINCRVSSQPNGWDSQWDDYYYGEEPKANIVWNYTGD